MSVAIVTEAIYEPFYKNLCGTRARIPRPV